MVTKSDYGLGPLYHGTNEARSRSILREGLELMEGQPIWLSFSQEEALENAQEKGGSPVVLEVNLPEDWILERAEAGSYLSWEPIPIRYIGVSPHYGRLVPHNLEALVPGDMTEEERLRRWFAYEDTRIKAVREFEEAKGKARRDALKYAWDEATYREAIAEAERTFHEEAEVKAKEILTAPSNYGSPGPPEVLPPTGTCYEDAWRFLIKQEEGFLIHGSVQLSAEGPRINHAWVEFASGHVYEPQTGQYFTTEDFRVLSPIEEHRYTGEQAAIMVARVGKHGPWSAEERTQWLRR